MRIKNGEIANALNLSIRAVQYRLSGHMDWTLTDYILLCKHFGEDQAKQIVGYNSYLADNNIDIKED